MSPTRPRPTSTRPTRRPVARAAAGVGAGAVVLWDGTNDPFARWSCGVPCWRWRAVPRRLGLATRRQLRARGLRPNGQAPAGRIECRRGARWAWLYRLDLAAPVRPMTPARTAALAAAMAARRWCPTCATYSPWVVPTRYGRCLDCLTDTDLENQQ